MIPTSNFKNGTKIELDKVPYSIVEFQHVKPGKGGAFVRTKLKNLLTGAVLEKTFRSSEKVNEPDILESQFEYLYKESDGFCFMDSETYEQTVLPSKLVVKEMELLKEGGTATILFYNGMPVSLTLPMFVELEVSHADPGVKGDTATGGTKPVTLETGGIVKVPLHISTGDLLKIDTRSCSFVERIRH